jgi:5-(carboxyamino)imidazole ribonucleotide synthase
MKSRNIVQTKIGILGGGQLGKMLCQAGSKLGLDISILEKDHSFPAASVCSQFICGDITKFDDVINFGLNMDVVTIEIENVNIQALEYLEMQGKKVYPSPAALKIIRDKGIQKEFYRENSVPTSPFVFCANAREVRDKVEKGSIRPPFVQKSRTEGYDGKGVHIVRSDRDLENLLDVPCLIEDVVDFQKEIAVIVARSSQGQMTAFPAVEMEFHPTANLVEYLICPASISAAQARIASDLAIEIGKKLEIVGLLAVEMFVDKAGNILVNEVAPRPHNSGHYTIEACTISQYEMHLRAILDLPLPRPELVQSAVMVNLLGEPDHDGLTYYEGLERCLAISGVHPHLYGKKETKPFRKMGHVTITDSDLNTAKANAQFVKNNLKVKSK